MKTININRDITLSEIESIFKRKSEKVVFKKGDLNVFVSVDKYKSSADHSDCFSMFYSVYHKNELGIYGQRTSSYSQLLYILNEYEYIIPEDNTYPPIKSRNGNYLVPIKGEYAVYYFWIRDNEILKRTTESEYLYLYNNNKYECHDWDVHIPENAIEWINEEESKVGDFIPYNENPFLYNNVMKRLFGNDLEERERENPLIKVYESSFISLLVECSGSYDTPYASDDEMKEITKKYQLVFNNKSTYRNDYRNRYRVISCGLNYIDFDSSGDYGCVNGLDFELKIYKKNI